MKSLFQREIIQDRCICSRCGNQISRREKRYGNYPDCLATRYWPTAEAQRVNPPPVGKPKAVYESISSYKENESDSVTVEANPVSIACECGLVADDNWMGEGSYPFGGKSLNELLECGERVAETLENKGFGMNTESVQEALKAGWKDGLDDYENLQNATEYSC